MHRWIPPDQPITAQTIRISRPRRSSLTVAAISLLLAQPLASSLSLADIAVLARTCRVLKDASERALVRSVSVIPRARARREAGGAEDGHGVRLYSASAVDSFARFAERWRVGQEGGRSDGGRMEKDEGENFADATERFQDGGGEDTAVRHSARPADARPSLRPRQLALYLHQLSSSTSLLRVLHLCASTLTHLRITYAEYLLTRDRRIYHALASLPHLTSLVIHAIGPRGCAFLKDLKAPLEDVEIEFDDDWVLSVMCASLDTPAGNNALVPGLFSGDSTGLPTPTATPATSPAAARGDVLVLPDPISLLANSMGTLRTLRASNAIIVTVADRLRYPRVKTLALRLASVPTVTPLVHAFPALTELYIYTPFDGWGVRAPVADPGPDSDSTDSGSGLSLTSPCSASPKRHLRPPMPSIHATRTANRTSQLYSSFPPLACVRGFVPGLYALGLTCGVRLLEIGALTPPSEGTEEARAVQKVLADAKPTSVSLGLGRGWWAEGRMTVRERDKDKGRVACSARRKRRETETETARDALTSIFGGNMADDEVWAGVTDLVLRVEEPGHWKHVTHDILAMLLPLTSTLTTFVLHWDRTSVPFDRIPHDDGYGDPESDISCAVPLSRAEAFARRTAEQSPSLRYALFKIMHDDPGQPPLTPKGNALVAAGSACMAPPPAPTPGLGLGPTCQLRAPLCESRFFRIERSQGWLCLDTLPAGVAEKVMAAEGLSFADRVRYINY